ncbi:MAG: peptidoglycan DD-metalloendopeptidase family protein [Filomicrobium sp.]
MTEFLSKMLQRSFLVRLGTPVVVGLLAGGLVAGCSADISRFSGPGFNLNAENDKPKLLPPESVTNTGNTLADQSPSSDYRRSTYEPIKTGTLSAPRSRGLERANQSSSSSNSNRGYSGQFTTNAPSSPPARFQRAASRSNAFDAPKASGETITVERGDTLYGLSRRHGVSVAELMSVNGLSDSMLRIGQTLKLPEGASSAASRSYARAKPQRPSLPRESVVAAEGVDAPATWGGKYEVRSGDSLYKIARQYGVRSRDLQRYNGITDPRRVMPGTVLRVPGGSVAPSTVAKSNADTNSRPSFVNSGKQYAALTDKRVSDARPAPATKGVRTVTISPPRVSRVAVQPTTSGDSASLLWPVRGKVIAGFGKRPDGTHNDGVNFAVPKGTDVRAAKDGVVAYAGSELRSYGNLVLLRHDNGWVTAYAHNDKLMVGRGDKVKRGQVIAKSGATGQVGQPQVHFELRKSSKKPVNPIPYMEKL